MKISLDELNINNEIEFEYEVVKDEELDKRILDLQNAFVKGSVYMNSNSDIILECNFAGTIILTDSISLENVPYDFNMNIEENLADIEENYQNAYEISKNTLDLKRILWQNIVLEVPISFTKVKDAKLKGDGWELIKNEKIEKDIDPRLKKLEELLERRD